MHPCFQSPVNMQNSSPTIDIQHIQVSQSSSSHSKQNKTKSHPPMHTCSPNTPPAQTYLFTHYPHSQMHTCSLSPHPLIHTCSLTIPTPILTHLSASTNQSFHFITYAPTSQSTQPRLSTPPPEIQQPTSATALPPGRPSIHLYEFNHKPPFLPCSS